MISKQAAPLFWFLLLFAIFMLAWSFASLDDFANNHRLSTVFGSVLGVAGYFFFSISLLLSSRWAKLEDWLGGLDKIYHLHRLAGILGFLCIFIHPWIEALKWLPHHVDRFAFSILPLHGRLSVNLGVIAFWMMLVILGVTFLKLLPYDKWKTLHKFMSLVFLLATLHVLLSDRRGGSETAHALLLIPMVLGTSGILYRQFFFPFFTHLPTFKIKKIKTINDNLLEVSLMPMQDILKFTPGQYGFFSFENSHLTKESHPFTLIESPNDSSLILLIKTRGDFTQTLHQNLKVGNIARFEGPYGRFTYLNAGKSQIWIAGGIGIVPFLAWIRSMKKANLRDFKIDLYYCAHRKVDAVFLDEFISFTEWQSNFRIFLHCSEENNRLDVQKIYDSSGNVREKKFLICGPKKLTYDFTKQLKSFGVHNSDIIFEDFEFF